MDRKIYLYFMHDSSMQILYLKSTIYKNKARPKGQRPYCIRRISGRSLMAHINVYFSKIGLCILICIRTAAPLWQAEGGG